MALFIWNCFEQVAGSGRYPGMVRRVLKCHGLLVVRVPNLLFYRALARSRTWEERLSLTTTCSDFLILYGYSMGTLDRHDAAHGFEHVRGFNSELLRQPFADLHSEVERSRSVSAGNCGAWSTAYQRSSLSR